MMSVARGAALMLAEGRPISGFSEGFRALATERVLGIPAPVLITIVIYAVAHFVLTRTVFGRNVYAIGGNEEAARLSGVQVRFHKTAVYGVAGLTSAAAAVVLTARLNSAQPTAGTMYELDAIAATVIGGSSLLGGEGTLDGHAHRRADHGRAAERAQPAERVVVSSAGRDWRGHNRRGAGGHGVEADASDADSLSGPAIGGLAAGCPSTSRVG